LVGYSAKVFWIYTNFLQSSYLKFPFFEKSANGGRSDPLPWTTTVFLMSERTYKQGIFHHLSGLGHWAVCLLLPQLGLSRRPWWDQVLTNWQKSLTHPNLSFCFGKASFC
jgi:hypothetical protein